MWPFSVFGLRSTCSGAFALLLAAWMPLACTSRPNDDYGVVSGACANCLSEQGCSTPYEACTAENSCDEYVMCQLMGRCYEREPDRSCEADLGCHLPPDESPGTEQSARDAASAQWDGGALDAGAVPDAGAFRPAASPRMLAATFETCARTTCASVCGFVRP